MIIKGRTAFYLFMLVCNLVIVTVWITGLNIHRTIADNAVYSLTILTCLFFTFVTYGLYKGVGLSDNFGNIKNKIVFAEPTGISGKISPVDLPIAELATEGIEGVVAGVLIWIGSLLFAVILVFFFETIIFSGLVIFTGMLYWIFYQAARLIFRYSRLTKNHIYRSTLIGLKYSLLYSSWIYGVIWAIEFIRDKNI